MRYKLPAILGILLLLALPAHAQHGGGGGHAGGSSGGHSMGGHSVGHAVGHSVGSVFGSHSGGHGSTAGHSQPPFAGAAMVHSRIVQLPGTGARGVRPITPHRPLTAFGFRQRRRFFGFAGFGGFGACSPFGPFLNGFAYDNGFSCLDSDFFYDPYFGSGYSPDFGDMQSPGENFESLDSDLADPEDYHPDVIIDNEPPPPADMVPHHRRSPREPDTILQLKDGSMYGLRDYWIADGRLHYVTSYGGQNSVPLAQIDVAKSNQLNSERGEKLAVDAH
jgi:hypothetical protein